MWTWPDVNAVENRMDVAETVKAPTPEEDAVALLQVLQPGGPERDDCPVLHRLPAGRDLQPPMSPQAECHGALLAPAGAP